MKSVTTTKFRKAFDNLPEEIQQRARNIYNVWKQDPYHTSLHFKKVHQHQPIFSVRVGLSYRALGVKEGDTMIWFWIGSHEEYNKLLREI